MRGCGLLCGILIRIRTNERRAIDEGQVARFFRPADRPFDRSGPRTPSAPNGSESGLVPSYRLVDTCAAEFEAYTPYYYSTYDRGDDEVPPVGQRRR